MIDPYLLYGIVIWSYTFKTYLEKLSVLQNKGLRMVAGNLLDNATECYAKLYILKLDDLYTFEIVKLMHKLVNQGSATYGPQRHFYPARGLFSFPMIDLHE